LLDIHHGWLKSASQRLLCTDLNLCFFNYLQDFDFGLPIALGRVRAMSASVDLPARGGLK
jgi:hypothetical protein